MDRQAQEYTYSQTPQYGYAPQPQQFPQLHLPPAQQPYMPHPSFPQFPPFGGPQQFYPHPAASYNFPPPPATSAPPPPFDPELQKRIDKLVEYIGKNGPEFENMIREKQSNNPEYSFLFGGEGHSYYRYKLLSTNFAPPAYQHMIPPQLPPYHQPLYEQPPPPYQARAFTGLRVPLPADIVAEMEGAMGALTGTKESIKAAKSWFMQRALFAPALAEALKDKVFSLDDSERQLHIIFLANDILFESLQHRTNPRELDNEARALLPVLGSMLSRVYNNPQNQPENQSRLMKIVQFWASKEVFDQETISALQREMVTGTCTGTVAMSYSVPPPDTSAFLQLPQNWQQDNPQAGSIAQPQITPPYPLPTQTPFSGPVPMPTGPSIPAPAVVSAPPNLPDPNPPPYPLFPPGLIPGMVRKMQIGSGVPYSPLSPLDIPTIIPPSPVPQSEILERVSKFFKEIGETNPSEGPVQKGEPDEYDDYERESPVRKGGACIPPPVSLNVVDPETGMHADGSVPAGTGTGRLGLGASVGPNDASQYDDVYSSYRKQRSTSYHSFMSSRAENR